MIFTENLTLAARILYNDIINLLFEMGEAAMILIFEQPDYARSVWCTHIVSSLVSELRLKRLPFCMISSLDELSGGTAGDFVFLVGSGGDFIDEGLKAAGRAGVYPILLNSRARDELTVGCSMVCSDMEGSMKDIVDRLRACGRGRIALYGVNPRSIGDVCRRAYFLKTAGAREDDIFFNDGSLENCFGAFRPRAHAYDAAICANDFAAISLVRRLSACDPGALERLFIIGCAETRLTDFYADHIVSVRGNFAEYGRAAVALIDTLKRNPSLSRVEMFIRWDVDALSADRAAVPPPEPAFERSAKTDAFYEDEELREMLCVERLLNVCDALDRQILRRTLMGESYEDVAERCFINVSTVKYRLRKMIGISGAESRTDLMRIVRRYLPEGASLEDEAESAPQ